MGKPHYFRFFTGDYRRATPHLTTEEHGAYLLIIMAMFDGGGDLPNDPVLLQRASTVKPHRWPRVWKTLAPFFTVEGDRIFQKRIKEEFRTSSLRIANLTAGSAIAREAKHLKSLSPTTTNQSQIRVKSDTKSGHTHSQSQEREREEGGHEGGSGSGSGSEGVTLRRGSEQPQHPRQPPVQAAPPAEPQPPPDDPLLDGMPAFGPAAFRLLFGQWPGQDIAKFNERPADAEAAFFKYISPDNYAPFVRALNAQLVGFANDHSPTARKDLGTFRTFCEERWTKYKEPPPPVAGPAALVATVNLDIPLMEV
jgi:uncharacterized protein YdaU (DUF1376 family)